jgi:PKHD-type hydroxylase
MIIIPNVLGAEQLAAVRAIIDAAEWIDGNATSGHQSALAKHNRQIAEGSAAAQEAGRIILDALGRSETFVAAALPLKVYPPLFNRYSGGERFGTHVDNAIRIRSGSDFRIRSDLSATLFLSDDYDGGELLVEAHSGAQAVKLPAGHMVLYPSSSLHRVEPVTRGERVASFFWVQSMVRDDGARRILYDLDNATRSVAATQGAGDRTTVELTGIYHNLLRRWADA